MTKKVSLLLIFICSFMSFLLGWFFAVFMLSGKDFSQQEEQKAEITEAEDPSPFLEQIKDNMLFLFDPYRWDQATRKNTLLESQTGYINKKPQNIELKKPELFLDNPKALSPLKPEKDNRTEELLSLEPAENLSEPLSPQLKTIQADFFKKNKAHLLAIENQQKFFKSDGKYSFLVNVFSTHDLALKYYIQIKQRYPLWSFLVKAYPDHIRIYLGPFPSKELALEFKNNLSVPYSLDYLEEVSL